MRLFSGLELLVPCVVVQIAGLALELGCGVVPDKWDIGAVELGEERVGWGLMDGGGVLEVGLDGKSLVMEVAEDEVVHLAWTIWEKTRVGELIQEH